ncbi:MAG: hypothetical protein CMJ74_01740 [Planctomycetaceae bacterium]|nr:hypothetical protein [Planctomycetaceae bacterium]
MQQGSFAGKVPYLGRLQLDTAGGNVARMGPSSKHRLAVAAGQAQHDGINGEPKIQNGLLSVLRVYPEAGQSVSRFADCELGSALRQVAAIQYKRASFAGKEIAGYVLIGHSLR